ncbi:MAG: D-alanyl-D-alanine carboxypeptidase/D-alanyl-D-alanine-endopeptidase [Thermodesulfobacteriota bacterium]
MRPQLAALFSLGKTARRFFFLFLFCWLLPAPSAQAGGGRLLPASLVENGGILVTRGGAILYEHNADTLLVPASTWKIATALEALTLLGPDYRFETRCSLGPDRTLYIQGSGDPMLISEEVSRLAEGLFASGVRDVGDLVLDDSAFSLDAPTDGSDGSLNPYDAANSALAVNFNTLPLVKDKNGAVRSAEPQTPTLDITERLAASLPPGAHRINISRHPEQVWRYAGELTQAKLREAGISVSGSMRPGSVPSGLAVTFLHRSSVPLSGMIKALLASSSNFMTNQLFLACGARRFGAPATWDKGRRSLDEFLTNTVHLAPGTFTVEEGSGLSRKNRITAKAMLTLLRSFAPHAGLLADHHGVPRKSGTLTGVYAYAGYFPGPTGLDPFVLLLNQPANTRDQVLARLQALHQGR